MEQECFHVKKVLNNNVIFSKNQEGQDIILTGLGLGFQKKKGDPVETEKIERIFILEEEATGNRLSELLKQIPIDYFYLADQIKQHAEHKLSKELNQNIYVTLCDHMYYAVERFKQGLLFQNQLMWEIKRFYPQEYQIALEAIKLMNSTLKVELPEDEASFVALHIINAELNGHEIQSVIDMTRLIKGICSIVQYEFKIDFDENSLNYTRFILHLKFFSQRLMMNEPPAEEASFLYPQVQENMAEAFQCSRKIASYIQKSYDYTITKSEQVYLTIHIERLLSESRKL